MGSSLFGLSVSWTSAWIFNCYVIDTGAGLVIVDPGLPIVSRQALTMIDRDLDRTAADVDAVLCTHSHPDHVAGVNLLKGASGCSVHVPRTCESYLAGETPRTFPLVASSVRFMPVYSEQRFSLRALFEFAKVGRRVGLGGPTPFTLGFQPDGFVDDAEPMPAAGEWEVIHAPGHTDDSTCLYHAPSATLISGDAVVSQGGSAWFNPEYVDPTVAAETEERLRRLEVRHLLPGHGRPLESADVWRTARSFTDKPVGGGLLARCSRRFGSW